jgi:hypothetical protein
LRTALPPETITFAHWRRTEVFDAFTLRDFGAAGEFPRVTTGSAAVGEPYPNAVFVETRTQYFVPGFNDVISKPNELEAGCFKTVYALQLLEISTL